ncbi:MAG: 2-amino-4-hydroxy-6-hydroxymethyldihydropteridine diphosphokinase [Paracoccus sp. (in: a-proteobacteria)]
MSANLALIALGANLSSSAGPPAETLRIALGLISDQPDIIIQAVSRLYVTPAHPPDSGPDYINACATLRSSLNPEKTLAVLHRIEALLGRHRDGHRWAARGIDLDLIAMDQLVVPDIPGHDRWRNLSPDQQMMQAPDQLILPHPRLQDRAFVLAPLADIAPGWRHPRLDLTVMEMLTALPATDRKSLRIMLDNPYGTDQLTVSASDLIRTDR